MFMTLLLSAAPRAQKPVLPMNWEGRAIHWRDVEEQTCVPSCSGELPDKIAWHVNVHLDAESWSSASLVEHLPRIWECLSRRWKNQSKPVFKLPRKLPRIPMEPFPAYPSGKSRDEAPGEMGLGQEFYHNVTPGADFTAREQ